MKIFFYPKPKNFNVLWTCPRGEKTLREGFAKLEEENCVQLVDNQTDADFIIYDYVPQFGNKKWDNTDLLTIPREKLVIVDWTDEYDRVFVDPTHPFLYFKRSFWAPLGSQIGSTQICTLKLGYRDNVEPIDYAIMDDFLISNLEWSERTYDLTCTLRPSCPNRALVLQNARLIQHSNPGLTFHIGEVNNASRSIGENVHINEEYFNIIHQSRIILTAGPTWWVGDFRSLESFAGGSLVFLDRDTTPLLDSLIPDKHFIEYSISDMKDLRDKIKFYFNHQFLARTIAKEGQRHMLENHRSVNRARYILNRINWKR